MISLLTYCVLDLNYKNQPQFNQFVLLKIPRQKKWEDSNFGQHTAGTFDRQVSALTDRCDSSVVCFHNHCAFKKKKKKLWRYCLRQAHSSPPHSIAQETQKTHKINMYYSYSPKPLFEYIKQAGIPVRVSMSFSRREAWQSKQRACVGLLTPGQLLNVDISAHVQIC